MTNFPTWLKPFLAGQYFAHCRAHVSSKNERNHFCVDCEEGPLCHTGWQAHLEHRTLQVRRASHMDAVRINDIQKLLDTSSIQPYTINGAKIIFLLSRPQSKLTKGSLRCCETCGRSISDPVRFCSITCKLACVIASYDDTDIFVKGGAGGSCIGRCSSREDVDLLPDDPGNMSSSPAASENADLNCVCSSSPTFKRHDADAAGEDYDTAGEVHQPELPPFKRSKLQILVKSERDNAAASASAAAAAAPPHQMGGLVPPSPNSVLSPTTPIAGGGGGGGTPLSCSRNPRSPMGHLLLFQRSPPQAPSTPRNIEHCSSPRARHRKGVPHRSPLF